jgi:hypothetical protein
VTNRSPSRPQLHYRRKKQEDFFFLRKAVPSKEVDGMAVRMAAHVSTTRHLFCPLALRFDFVLREVEFLCQLLYPKPKAPYKPVLVVVPHIQVQVTTRRVERKRKRTRPFSGFGSTLPSHLKFLESPAGRVLVQAAHGSGTCLPVKVTYWWKLGGEPAVFGCLVASQS